MNQFFCHLLVIAAGACRRTCRAAAPAAVRAAAPPAAAPRRAARRHLPARPGVCPPRRLLLARVRAADEEQRAWTWCMTFVGVPVFYG